MKKLLATTAALLTTAAFAGFADTYLPTGDEWREVAGLYPEAIEPLTDDPGSFRVRVTWRLGTFGNEAGCSNPDWIRFGITEHPRYQQQLDQADISDPSRRAIYAEALKEGYRDTTKMAFALAYESNIGKRFSTAVWTQGCGPDGELLADTLEVAR